MKVRYIVSDASSFYEVFSNYERAIEEAKKHAATVIVEATIGLENYQTYEEEIYCNGELMSKEEVDDLLADWELMDDGRCTP